MRDPRQDDGQLMMLAGIVLTISFILTALTLSQVSSLQQQATAEGTSPIVAEWRFLSGRIASNLHTAIGPETTNESFNESILPTIAATFRSVESEKGYDLVIRKAGGDNYTWNGNEASLISTSDPTKYNSYSYDGAVHFQQTVLGSTTDGILWEAPCPDVLGPSTGCISGLHLFVRLSDGVTSLEESVVYAVNR